MYAENSLLTSRKYILHKVKKNHPYQVVYSKGKMPENVISCDIRNFLEDNSLTEAVVFVKL